MTKAIVLSAALIAACGSSTPSSDGPTKPETFAAQVERGAALYGSRCASCHGADGTGDSAPAVVGEGALPLEPRPGSKRDVKFATAADVFAWVKQTMPADAPGSLTDAQYVDILAFDLKANGVDLDKPLDGSVAASLKLH